MSIGKIIKDLRKEKGLSQTQLAEKLCTTQDTVSLWELEKSYPDILRVKQLALIFGVTTDYLLGLED